MRLDAGAWNALFGDGLEYFFQHFAHVDVSGHDETVGEAVVELFASQCVGVQHGGHDGLAHDFRCVLLFGRGEFAGLQEVAGLVEQGQWTRAVGAVTGSVAVIAFAWLSLAPVPLA